MNDLNPSEEVRIKLNNIFQQKDENEACLALCKNMSLEEFSQFELILK